MTEVRTYPTPKGGFVRMAMRPDLVDEPVIASTAFHDEYGVAEMALKDDALMVDVGAYVGSVGLAVAADYPTVRVVMIEAIPENVEVIRESIIANGWQGRVMAYNAAADSDAGFTAIRYGVKDEATDFQRSNQFIGNLLALDAPLVARVPNMSLSDITGIYGDVAWLKIDCEGCEYGFLMDPQIWRVANIVGEYHRGQEALSDLLSDTHDLAFTPENDHVGIFRASRR